MEELWNQVDHEQSICAQLSASRNQMNEKILSLENQIRDLNEKVKVESENNMKLKKSNAELCVVSFYFPYKSLDY